MKQDKLVSIIIPVYKAEKYVAKTVNSALEQTYKNIEILIIDDGSPDRSLEICQQLTDPRITIISQQNRGLPGARNTGIRYAKGKYLAFLDADDLWLPEKIEKHIEHLENSPAVGVSFSRSAFIDGSGQSLGIYQIPKLENITPTLVLCRNPISNGSAAVIRRKVFQDIKFQDNLYGAVENFYFDEQLNHSNSDATDVECWLRITIKTNWQIEGIAEALTLYRVNSGGLSANTLQQLSSLEEVIEKTRSYAPELIDRCGKLARAYHLRYTARRAVSLQDGSLAVQLINQSLATNWQIIIQEPRRTILSFFAAYLLYLLPQSLYSRIEALALKITGAAQKRRILQEIS